MTRTSTIERAYCPECGEQFDPGTKTCPDDGSRLYSYQVRENGDDPLINRTIEDRFRIDSILGEGGMGRVYRGVQLSVQRPVAIKVLRPELINREDVIQRFFREARVISGFNHPNIVNLVDFGQDAEHNVLYLAMELLDGMPLSDVMVLGRAHPNLACEVAVQVSRALAEAHAREIVHRDLKPDNLMLVPMSDGSVQVKVLDFGIAHAVQGEKKLTSTGQVFGTAHYMAPEQASAQEVGPLTDVYALGCILYEMICGELPFDAPSVMGLLVSHVQQQPPHLAERLSDDDIPDALVDLVMQMLEKAPADRPDSVLAVRDQAEQIRAAEGFGPLRVEPNQKLDGDLFRAWLRGDRSSRLRHTSDALQPATGDHTRETVENPSLATDETAAHPSAPSIGEATPSPDLPSDRSAPVAAQVSHSSIELEFAKLEENKRLFRLAGALFLVVLAVAGVAAIVATSGQDSNSVAVSGEDAGRGEGTETVIAQPEPELTAPIDAGAVGSGVVGSGVVGSGVVGGAVGSGDAGIAAQTAPEATDDAPETDEPIAEKESGSKRPNPTQKPTHKPTQKSNKPNEKETRTNDDPESEKAPQKTSVDTVVLPM